MIILCYIHFVFLGDLLMLSYHPKEIHCYVVNYLWRKLQGRRSWGIDDGFQVTTSKKLELSVLYNHKAMNSANNTVSLEVDFSSAKFSDDNAIWPKVTLIATL